MGNRMKKFLIGILVSVIILTGVAGTGLIIVGRPLQGILQGGAYIIASDAPTLDRQMGRIFHTFYGARVAVCDGSADQVQIMAALVASEAPVTLSGGSFNVTANITMSKNFQGLIGQGFKTILKLDAGADDDVIVIKAPAGQQSCWNVIIKDLKIDGTKATNSQGSGITGVPRRSILENIWVYQTNDDGIAIEGVGTGNRINWPIVEEVGRYGISVNCTDTWITDAIVGNSDNASIYMAGASTKIINGHFWQNWVGVIVSPLASLTNCQINDNYFEYMDREAILVNGCSLYYTTINNNVFWRNSRDSAGTYNDIDNKIASTYYLQNVTIMGNSFDGHDYSGYGLDLGTRSRYNLIVGNSFSRMVSGNITGTLTDNIIQANYGAADYP